MMRTTRRVHHHQLTEQLASQHLPMANAYRPSRLRVSASREVHVALGTGHH